MRRGKWDWKSTCRFRNLHMWREWLSMEIWIIIRHSIEVCASRWVWYIYYVCVVSQLIHSLSLFLYALCLFCLFCLFVCASAGVQTFTVIHFSSFNFLHKRFFSLGTFGRKLRWQCRKKNDKNDCNKTHMSYVWIYCIWMYTNCKSIDFHTQKWYTNSKRYHGNWAIW